jgi:hypothetical protein
MLILFLFEKSTAAGAWSLNKLFAVLAWPLRLFKKRKFDPELDDKDHEASVDEGTFHTFSPEEELEEWYKVRAGAKESDFETRDVPEIVADMIDEDDDFEPGRLSRYAPGPVRFTPYPNVKHSSAADPSQFKIKSTSRGPRGEIVKNNWMQRATFSHKLHNAKQEEI